MFFPSPFADNIISSSKYRPSKSDPAAASSWQDGISPPLFRSSQRTSPEILQLRFSLSLLVLFLSFAILCLRLFNLQVVKGKENFFLSEGNRIRVQRLRPERGIIFDREAKVLARNAPGFNVGIDLSKLELSSPPRLATQEVVEELARVLAIPAEELQRRIDQKRSEGVSEVILKSGVQRDLVFVIETQLGELPGVFVEVAPIREYPYGEMLAHVLGYTGEISPQELAEFSPAVYTLSDRVGKIGLEKIYDEYLHGKSGKRLLETDARGTVLREIAKEEPVAGNALYLNLDLDLQKAAFEALKKSIEKNKGTGGVVVVEAVNTGELKALVVLPAFDPNVFSSTLTEEQILSLLNDPLHPLFNRAISAVYPPGSTFKMITASAALEEGVVRPSTKIEEVQTIYVGGSSFSNWTLAWGVPPHGLLNIVQAIAHSSDIYFYEVGGGYGDQIGVGEEKLAFWARSFGLGVKSGLDLAGEAAGLVPDEGYKREKVGEDWFLGDTYNMAIGQGYVLTTPLQMANVTAAVANGGKLLRPFLAKSIKDSEGREIVKFEPKVKNKNFVSEETLSLVRQGMREAVEYGTAVALKNMKFPVAGKTGTSETGLKDKNHAWFTAFAPYDNPEIVVSVFVEEGGQGSLVALPVAQEVLAYYFGEGSLGSE